MSEKNYIALSLKRRKTQEMAKEFASLEKRFNSELNNVTLPCGEKARLAASIPRHEKVKIMMTIKGFAEYIPISSPEWVMRLIDAHAKKIKRTKS
jgi:hypothetical protein